MGPAARAEAWRLAKQARGVQWVEFNAQRPADADAGPSPTDNAAVAQAAADIGTCILKSGLGYVPREVRWQRRMHRHITAAYGFLVRSSPGSGCPPDPRRSFCRRTARRLSASATRCCCCCTTWAALRTASMHACWHCTAASAACSYSSKTYSRTSLSLTARWLALVPGRQKAARRPRLLRAEVCAQCQGCTAVALQPSLSQRTACAM